MQKRTLGKAGPETTAVGFGAWAIGGLGYGEQDTEAAGEALDEYFALGGRLIDTARGYGVSEILVGKALRRFGRRDEVYVASKSGNQHPPVVRTDLETSRFCLGVDRLDLYYIHVPPPDPDKLDRLLDVYAALREAGKMKQLGVSCRALRTQEEIDQAWRIVEDPRVDVVQIPHSFARQGSAELIRAAGDRGLGVVTRSNLLGGILTGKYAPGYRFADPANDWRASLNGEKLDELLTVVADLVEQVVQPPYQTLAQVAIAYSLHTPGVSAVIPGARSAEQVRANAAIDDMGPLPENVRDRLDEAGKQIQQLVAAARAENRSG